jgi:C-8 sterol isomerase
MGYLFEPQKLHEIAKKAVGLPFEQMCATVIDELSAAYPGHVETRQDWVYNMAAGATGIMTILHGSLTEYLILFGTPIGTEAFSGRYFLDIHDFILAGEMHTYTEEHPGRAVVTGPGEAAVLHRGRVKGFRFDPACWALEYGRGPIPTSLPTALSDSLLSALDPQTVVRTFWLYGRQVFKELLRGKL